MPCFLTLKSKTKVVGGTRSKAIDHRSTTRPVRSFFPLSFQGKYDEADALCMREVENTEKAVGSDHPLLANTLINRALLLQSQVGADRYS